MKQTHFCSNTSGKFINHNHPTHTEQSSQTNKQTRVVSNEKERKGLQSTSAAESQQWTYICIEYF